MMAMREWLDEFRHVNERMSRNPRLYFSQK